MTEAGTSLGSCPRLRDARGPGAETFSSGVSAGVRLGEGRGTSRSKVRSRWGEKKRGALRGPRQSRPLRVVSALPHRGELSLASSPLEGRPNAAEPLNPFRPADSALAMPPASAAPKRLQALEGHGEQGKVMWEPSRGQRVQWLEHRSDNYVLGPWPAAGCVTLGTGFTSLSLL